MQNRALIDMSIYHKIELFIEKLSLLIAVVGGFGLIGAMLITCISIVGKLVRRLLDITLSDNVDLHIVAWIRPILGEEELVQYGVGFALFAALPWVTLQKGHVTIDLLARYFNAKTNQIINLLADCSIAMIAYMLLTRQWHLLVKKERNGQEGFVDYLLSGDVDGIISSIKLRDESQILSIPLWPLYMAAEFCIFIFFIIAVFCMIRSLLACCWDLHTK